MALAQRLLEIPAVRRSDRLRTFITAAWLGWQIETNWADPLIFIIYFVARPIAALAILVVMYSIIAADSIGTAFFAYVYLGSALYLLTSQIIVGISWVVIEDREQYRVAKQLHTAPIDGYVYLVGRGMARFIVGILSVLVTVPFGVLIFNIPVTLAGIDVPLLLVSTIFGLAAMAALGVMIGSFTMQVSRQVWFIGDAISGALYLLTGAVFPIDLLPEFLRPLSYLLPSTYWLELARRALLGDNAIQFQAISALDSGTMLVILMGMSALLMLASVFVYRWSLRRAKERGVLDMESNF
jgi:ABC-2 type transport system permease protein